MIDLVELLAASGGDTVKLFNLYAWSGDRCVSAYIPSPGCHVNSLNWNHTNLVVASAGEDKKISLWHKDGHSLGTIPTAETDNIEVLRLWDLQTRRCVKRLRGHTSTITGAVYNCNDEHLASVGLNGDVIVHEVASGNRASEFKDPNGEVLRMLDYSRYNEQLLVTASDDGSVHLWDITCRSPKISWLKQHSALPAGISFSPSNDKLFASVGLDKKLYIYDSGSRRHSSCISYEAPFSALAFKADGCVVAAGTSSGRVVLYDVRGKPEPFLVLRAYSSSQAVTSISWQRSKSVIVNESSCSVDAALLGDVEDSFISKNSLPKVTSSNSSISMALKSYRNPGCSGFSADRFSATAAGSGIVPTTLNVSSAEDNTSHSVHLWPGGTFPGSVSTSDTETATESVVSAMTGGTSQLPKSPQQEAQLRYQYLRRTLEATLNKKSILEETRSLIKELSRQNSHTQEPRAALMEDVKSLCKENQQGSKSANCFLSTAMIEADEKKAMIEAEKGRELLKAEEMATKYRATGGVPKKFLGCF